MSLSSLVSGAALTSPQRLPFARGSNVSLGTLRERARYASGGDVTTDCPDIDDSGLMIALMTSIPGLAAAGPDEMRATLTGLRAESMRTMSEQPN